MIQDLAIFWPALVAGLLVAATHVPLGIRVLERGIVFIDLAVAQIAGLGPLRASHAGPPPSPPFARACRSAISSSRI